MRNKDGRDITVKTMCVPRGQTPGVALKGTLPPFVTRSLAALKASSFLSNGHMRPVASASVGFHNPLLSGHVVSRPAPMQRTCRALTLVSGPRGLCTQSYHAPLCSWATRRARPRKTVGWHAGPPLPSRLSLRTEEQQLGHVLTQTHVGSQLPVSQRLRAWSRSQGTA